MEAFAFCTNFISASYRQQQDFNFAPKGDMNKPAIYESTFQPSQLDLERRKPPSLSKAANGDVTKILTHH